MKSLFQRMNFFKGLFTKAEDWRQEQSYHIEKRALHNRCFHTPGVVTAGADEENNELKESLRVSVTPKGSVTVQPGYAVDSQGRDLYLPEPKELDIDPKKAETNIYFYIAYGEQRIDERRDAINPDFTGHAFVVENPVVGWTDQEPDNREKIELARIHWKKGQRLTPEQIDLSHVLRAGTRLGGSLWKCVQQGDTAAIEPAKSWDLGNHDEPYLIESFPNQDEAAGAAYVATAFPKEPHVPDEARIHWWIVSSRSGEGERVNYHLYFKNFGSKAVKVRYQVFRADVGSMW